MLPKRWLSFFIVCVGVAAWSVEWNLAELWHAAQAWFAPRGPGDLMPLLLTVTIALGIRVLFDKPGKVRSLVVIVLLLLNLRYILWRAFATLSFSNEWDSALSTTFFFL